MSEGTELTIVAGFLAALAGVIALGTGSLTHPEWQPFTTLDKVIVGTLIVGGTGVGIGGLVYAVTRGR